MSADDLKELDDPEVAKARARTVFLSRLQWYLNLLTGILSAVAIGLQFAKLTTLAQITLGLILLVFICSVYLAYYRYKRNRDRRDEILAVLDKERDTQLREVFDEARRERNLPPDATARDGFAATLKDIEEKAAERRNQQLGRRPKKGASRGERK